MELSDLVLKTILISYHVAAAEVVSC